MSVILIVHTYCTLMHTCDNTVHVLKCAQRVKLASERKMRMLSIHMVGEKN